MKLKRKQLLLIISIVIIITFMMFNNQMNRIWNNIPLLLGLIVMVAVSQRNYLWGGAIALGLVVLNSSMFSIFQDPVVEGLTTQDKISAIRVILDENKKEKDKDESDMDQVLISKLAKRKRKITEKDREELERILKREEIKIHSKKKQKKQKFMEIKGKIQDMDLINPNKQNNFDILSLPDNTNTNAISTLEKGIINDEEELNEMYPVMEEYNSINEINDNSELSKITQRELKRLQEKNIKRKKDMENDRKYALSLLEKESQYTD